VTFTFVETLYGRWISVLVIYIVDRYIKSELLGSTVWSNDICFGGLRTKFAATHNA